MPAGRVLATQQAREAANQLLALTGPVKEQVGRVLQYGGVLADPNQWEGGLAGQWRHDWDPDSNHLRQTAARLDQLEHRAHQAIEDIFKADTSPFDAAELATVHNPGGDVDSGAILKGNEPTRAKQILDRIPPADRATFEKLLEGSSSPEEAAYLWKALAAGHSLAKIEQFDAAIRLEALARGFRLPQRSLGSPVHQTWPLRAMKIEHSARSVSFESSSQ